MKRQPVAELGCEDYRIVKFTHDIELAKKLMTARLEEEYGSLGDVEQYWDSDLSRPRQEWIRIVPCLPGSYGEDCGWAFEYQPAKAGSRGAFKAVVFS